MSELQASGAAAAIWSEPDDQEWTVAIARPHELPDRT